MPLTWSQVKKGLDPAAYTVRTVPALVKKLKAWEDYCDGERPLAERHQAAGQGLMAPMAVISAGVLVYRQTGPRPEFLLGHPGGPLWARKDLGAWMVPKGLIEAGEDPAAAAVREFEEETGLSLPGSGRALGAACAKPAARRCSAGRPRRTSILRPSSRVSSRWNGRRAPGSARAFPRSTAWPISTTPRR